MSFILLTLVPLSPSSFPPSFTPFLLRHFHPRPDSPLSLAPISLPPFPTFLRLFLFIVTSNRREETEEPQEKQSAFRVASIPRHGNVGLLGPPGVIPNPRKKQLLSITVIHATDLIGYQPALLFPAFLTTPNIGSWKLSGGFPDIFLLLLIRGDESCWLDTRFTIDRSYYRSDRRIRRLIKT